ncbi:saccharopine dehydrogenase family protein, partial [Patescibacteria group bacterium]
IAVLGAGMQACGVAHYLKNDERVRRAVYFDNNDKSLVNIRRYLGNNDTTAKLDLSDQNALFQTLKRGCFDGVLNALPHTLLKKTTETVIRAQLPMVDFGQAREKQIQYHELAKKLGVVCSPAHGLAPGFISNIAFYAKSQLDICDRIEMLCGDILQEPIGESGHLGFFSHEGFDEEYRPMPIVIKNGVPTRLQYLTPQDPEIFVMPDGRTVNNRRIIKVETALTAKAFEADPKLWNVNSVRYATCRHFGYNHFKTVSEAIRTKTPKEFLNWLKTYIPLATDEKDMIVLRVRASGKKNGAPQTVIYEIIDFYDEKTNLSAAQRGTTFPAAEHLLQIIENPDKWPKGVVHHEPYVDFEATCAGLAKHNLIIRPSMSTFVFDR